jgi:hypothetical protein
MIDTCWKQKLKPQKNALPGATRYVCALRPPFFNNKHQSGRSQPMPDHIAEAQDAILIINLPPKETMPLFRRHSTRKSTLYNPHRY